jgi:uncharacterized protein YaiI (UPF0178 family)
MTAGKLFFVESVYSKMGKGYQKSAISDQEARRKIENAMRRKISPC